MYIGPSLGDGSVPIGYGDWGVNTGPIDVLAITPVEFEVVTLLSQMDTEATTTIRHLSDDYHYIPAIDPKNNVEGAIATNAPDGEWKYRWVSAATYDNPAHIFDVYRDGDTLLACGSTWGGEAGESTVWFSSDEGVTWGVELRKGQGRFYEFKLIGSRPAVQLNFAGPWFVRQEDGSYVEDSNPFFDERPMFPPSVWVDGNNRLRHTGQGILGTLPTNPTGHRWQASLTPDGSIWLCDTEKIYYLQYYIS